MMAQYIGVDIGGTFIKSGLIAENGKIIERMTIRTEAEKNKSVVIKNIIEAIKPLFNRNVGYIGIGCPGPLDIKNGVVLDTPHLPLRNVNLKRAIENEFRAQVVIDNDANCFTLAQAIFGEAQYSRYVLGITLGTGFGSGLVVNKKIYHGRGNALELGHTTINYDGGANKCCGNNECVENLVASTGILKAAKEYKLKVTTPLDVYNLALKNNSKAIEVFDTMGHHLGISLANFINGFDPDVIIIGGEIANAWKFFARGMNKEIKKRCFFKPCEVVKNRLHDAGILGAAGLVMETTTY